jgi:hypothetical protein
MPTKYQPYTNTMDDGRRKIHPDLHPVIRMEHESGVSQRSLASKYGVSRRLIVFILHPERLKVPNWKKYYTKQSHRDYMRKCRAKKRMLGLKT